MSDTDYALGAGLAGVLTGRAGGDLSRPISEEKLMELERSAMLELAARPETRARMAHMLETGRPLRN